ncbi:hypothetical protein GCK72_000779 [Caenorhabditis remanei]|uniref:Uncharacterized protein n=1 Tax=Caenorhabditis remanei TaxID=31234 RepID=A0A6A5HQL6_CAERE|nr:hypothetical protein GCK72_000779 [Caenorhabditis remanei]KAF1768966.1 hypothetical protein GCK72_000779 [Caenorhabditis remanei]
MASDNAEIQVGEDARLLLDNQNLKQTWNARPEYLCEQSRVACSEVEALKAKNADLHREKQALIEKNSVQEVVTGQAKTYATMLEAMLDEANHAHSLTRVTWNEEKKKYETAMKELKELGDRLRQENQELNDMMEEFRAMWKKDTQNFQETLKAFKAERAEVQMEVERLTRLCADEQDSLITCYELKDKEEDAHRETQEKYEKLQAEMKNVVSKHEATQGQLQDLLQQKQIADSKLAAQEHLMKSQSAELAAALDDLIKSRQNTEQHLQDMKDCWEVKEQAYEHRLSEMARDQEETENYHEMEKSDLTDRLRELFRQRDELSGQFAASKASVQEELEMLRAECNINYENYVKFQVEAANLEKSLRECNEKREMESNMFEKALVEVEAKLSETTGKLIERTNRHDETLIKLKDAEDDLANCRSHMYSTANDFMKYRKRSEENDREREQLREQVTTMLRDFVIEKEKMEQKQEETVAAVQQRFMKQIEEIKYNHMLAINQEMIKAQMALDAEKKKHAIESEAIKTKLEETRAELSLVKMNTTAKLSLLNQEVITVRNHNVSVRNECASLKGTQDANTAQISRLLTLVDELEKRDIEKDEEHEIELYHLKKAHRELVDNMGVEELDDDKEQVRVEEVSEKNESADWELVDEE